jgi:hypothetical protein
MDANAAEALNGILKVAPLLHTAGVFSPAALEALARHASRRTVLRSAETGCGATTLLLSHLSANHTVFALDAGSGSVVNVQRSPLLRRETVTFVEGPTQVTLPRHEFTGGLQLALLDGPHAYPFPDLEYYFLYPHLEPGALLVLDDIQIRSIHRLFQFLRRDSMFELDEVVRTTAFFTRTEAPVFDLLGDGWWQQRYNARPLLRYTWRERVKAALPARWRRLARRHTAGCEVSIQSPRSGEGVAERGTVTGMASVRPGAHLWVLAHRRDVDGWWLQGGGPVEVAEGRWTVSVSYGEPHDAGHEFEIAAVIVEAAIHEFWMDKLRRNAQEAKCDPVGLPARGVALAECYRTVRKR